MKKIIFIRHGKSSWESNVRDHDRVLIQRGVEDAHLIGENLKLAALIPDAIWSSTAARALQTAIIVSEYLDYNLETFIIKRELYTFNSTDLINEIRNCSNDIDSLMLFSHNHGLTDAVNQLGSIYFENVPTTGAVVIEFQTNRWDQLKKGQTIVNFFPKNLR